MANYRPKSTEPKDYKERFEFCLTVGDNIICQRYFKINGFNPLSTSSVELASVMEDLATKIDNDLKEKSAIYLETDSTKILWFRRGDEQVLRETLSTRRRCTLERVS